MDQETQLEERAALKQLAEKYSMFGSHLVHYEVMNTPDETQRDNLIIDYKALEPVSKDVKIYGFQTQRGGDVGRAVGLVAVDEKHVAVIDRARAFWRVEQRGNGRFRLLRASSGSKALEAPYIARAVSKVSITVLPCCSTIMRG